MSDGSGDRKISSNAPVGYCRPPAEHAFKPGQSGNPRGRPKKPQVVTLPPAISDTLAVDAALLNEAYRPIQLREGDATMTLSTVSAVYRSMAVAAVKGNRFAQRTFTERVQQAEARRRGDMREIIDIASSYKFGWTDIFDDHARRGLPPPNVLPHPSDIVEGPGGMPYVVGPQTEPEQRHWSKLQARAADADLSIREGLSELKLDSNQKYRSFIFDEMVYEHRTRLLMRKAAPSPDARRQLGYRRPTQNELKALSTETKTRYRLYKDLSEAEQRSFIWEMERYEVELAAGRIP